MKVFKRIIQLSLITLAITDLALAQVNDTSIAVKGECTDCEEAPSIDLNACTSGVNNDKFFLSTTGPGSKYDSKNNLHYGFALKKVSPAPFRSDYSEATVGTATNPLSITDCFLFDRDDTFQSFEGCWAHAANRIWNYPGMVKINYSSGSNFWVLSLNNEDVGGIDESWEDPLKDSFHECNSGPPNVSFVPNKGSTQVYGDGSSFNLSLDLKAFHTTDKQVSCGEYSTPFFGFGAQCKRGNPHPVAYINTDKSKKVPSVLKFKSAVTKYIRENKYLAYRLMVIAEWEGTDTQGKKRMMDRLIFLNLSHPTDRGKPVTAHLASKNWNWPSKKSFYFPGADLGFFDAGKMVDLNNCSAQLQNIAELREFDTTRNFKIDLTELYKCADENNLFKDKMPIGKTLAVKGVHWVLEGVGTEGQMDVNIEDMEIVTEFGHGPMETLTGLNSDCSDRVSNFVSNGSVVQVNICARGLSPIRERALIWAAGGVRSCNAATDFKAMNQDWNYVNGQWVASLGLSSTYVSDVTVCTKDADSGEIHAYYFKMSDQEQDPNVILDRGGLGGTDKDILWVLGNNFHAGMNLSVASVCDSSIQFNNVSIGSMGPTSNSPDQEVFKASLKSIISQLTSKGTRLKVVITDNDQTESIIIDGNCDVVVPEPEPEPDPQPEPNPTFILDRGGLGGANKDILWVLGNNFHAGMSLSVASACDPSLQFNNVSIGSMGPASNSPDQEVFKATLKSIISQLTSKGTRLKVVVTDNDQSESIIISGTCN